MRTHVCTSENSSLLQKKNNARFTALACLPLSLCMDGYSKYGTSRQTWKGLEGYLCI